MAVVVVLLVILETFAFMLHGVPLLFDEDLSPNGFDDIQQRRRPTHSSLAVFIVRPCHSPNEQRMVVR